MSRSNISTIDFSQVEKLIAKSSDQLKRSVLWFSRQVSEYSSEFAGSANSALSRSAIAAKKSLIQMGEFLKTAEGKGFLCLGFGLSLGMYFISRAESTEYHHKPLLKRAIQICGLTACILTGAVWATIVKA